MTAIIRSLISLVVLGFSAMAVAGPVIAPGDMGLRHDIQVLADWGVIRGPTTTWPLDWTAIEADLRRARDTDMNLPVPVRSTFNSVYARAQRELQRGRQHWIKGRAAVAAEPMTIRGFQDTPREEGELSVGYEYFNDRFTVDLNVTGVSDASDGEDVRPDGSLATVRFGNFSYGISTMDRWWGPAWDGGQIYSSNARPMPSFVIERDRTDPFETKWLSWLGPWDLSFVWGQMEEEREVPNTKFLGVRFAFKPHPAWEIGVSRTAQWCGDGRPCDFETFWDLLWGRDNVGEDGVTPENEAGNQLAGIDVRVSNTWFGTPMALYANATAEDEAGGFPSRYMIQGGIESSGYIRNRWSYRWFAEAAYNACDAIKSDPIFNCAYNHGIYRTGYRYYGRTVGHGAENDALIGSAGLIFRSSRATTWQIIVRLGELNRGGDPDVRNTITPTPQDLASVDLQFAFDTRLGQFEFGAGYEEIDDEISGTKADDTRAFLTWRSR